jgi:hypothetical protein
MPERIHIAISKFLVLQSTDLVRNLVAFPDVRIELLIQVLILFFKHEQMHIRLVIIIHQIDWDCLFHRINTFSTSIKFETPFMLVLELLKNRMLHSLGFHFLLLAQLQAMALVVNQVFLLAFLFRW